MNDMRERLVQLLCAGTAKTETCNLHDDCATAKGDCGFCTIMADFLLAHGVTVQEWISVKDRLPKDRDWVLVNHTGYATPKKAKYKDDFSPHLPVFLIDGDNGNKGEVTHWMPMPNLPSTEGSK